MSVSGQRRLSRPSSAASHSSRTSAHHDSEVKLECRAAFLGQYDDLRDEIESKEDLMLLLQQTGRNPSSRVIARYWQEGMTFDDFVDVCRREPVTTEDDLMKAFRKIDINGDGYISLDELYKVMTTKGEKMSRSEVKAMIDEVDENRDGRLDYKEFAKMVISTSEDFKKMSVKVMEKKERKRMKNASGREKDEASLGSQLSIRSSASDKRRERRTSSSSRHQAHEGGSEGRRRSRPSSVNSRRQQLIDDFSTEETSLRSASRLSLHSNSLHDEIIRQSPRDRRESRPKSGGKGRKSEEPYNLREWTGRTSKGNFFLDEEQGTINHLFSLELSEDTDVWITIQPLKIGESGESLDGTVIDTALFILRDDDESMVAFTEHKDSRGKYSLRCSLSQGSYILVPFTTGCRLRSRQDQHSKEAKIISKDKEGKIILTRAFRKALDEIFEMSDLDNNGLLSRDEFSWYNLRTSEEMVGDEEWQVVLDHIELERGEIPRSGFIKLMEMEADDNQGDTDDLWITLTNMGFNNSLIIDKACPFQLKVYTQDCRDPELKVTGLESCQEKIDKAICELVMAKGEKTSVRSMKDLHKYIYANDHRAAVVIDNGSKTRVKMQLDCTRNRGLVSHTGSMMTTVTVPAMSSVVGLHLLPLDDRSSDFSVTCEETVLK